jgi:hypothetical protein
VARAVEARRRDRRPRLAAGVKPTEGALGDRRLGHRDVGEEPVEEVGARQVGRDLAPGLVTSSPRLGTSKSWQIRTSDRVAAGSSLHARWGLTLSEKATPLEPSSRPQA